VAILDDLMSDEAAKSPTIVETITNTVYKAVSKALHPTRQKMIFIGTPFNARDPLYMAVESGAWTVSVFPVCETYPCSRADFRGSWEDRFTYDYVKAEYDEAMALNRPENFYQELMLRIMSEEDRLVLDSDITWYKRASLIKNKSAYNYYITTDFATSAKKGADFSVLSVWAYTNNGDWMLVDGVCKKQLMDANINDLFRLVTMYKPLSVGVEVTGQQGGFISWINQEMINRNIFFNLASGKSNGNNPGIRPISDKLTRFNQVLPLFKQKKVWFPEEMKGEPYMEELEEELRNVSKKGFKSKHDDVSDTISMLSEIEAYRPSIEVVEDPNVVNIGTMWGDEWEIADRDDDNRAASTIF
jgi:predicted phage terminase large subunit-like protein